MGFFAWAQAASAQASAVNPAVVTLARRYLTTAVFDQRPLVLTSNDLRVWSNAAGVFKTPADPQQMAAYMNGLLTRAQAQLKIPSGTPITKESAPQLTRAMWNLLPDRAIPPAKPNEHPLTHDTAFLALRLVPNSGATPDQLADQWGLPKEQIQNALDVMHASNALALTYDVMFSLDRRVAAFQARSRSPRPPTARDFVLQILDPYLLLIEASTQSGRQMGVALDGPVSALFDHFMSGPQSKGALLKFIQMKRTGTLSASLAGAMIDALKSRGFWVRIDEDQFFILCEVTTEVPVRQSGIESVLLVRKIGLSRRSNAVGKTLPVVKYVAIFEDEWEASDRAEQRLLTAGNAPSFAPQVLAALDHLGLDSGRVAAAMNRIYAEKHRDLTDSERREIGLQTTGVHELKHKFDELKGVLRRGKSIQPRNFRLFGQPGVQPGFSR